MSDLRKAAQDVVTVWKMYGTAESLRGWMEILEAALAEPVQEPVSVTDLQQALVETNLIDPDAIDDPEGYDYGSTVAQIDALHEMLFKSQRPAEPVQEPVAKVELMTTGGNAGLATRIVEIDDHLRERLRPGQLLYTAPPQRKENT